jgi:hypothetical protein
MQEKLFPDTTSGAADFLAFRPKVPPFSTTPPDGGASRHFHTFSCAVQPFNILLQGWPDLGALSNRRQLLQ